MLDEMVPLASRLIPRLFSMPWTNRALLQRSHLARQIGSANLNITWDLRVIVQHQIRCC